MEDLTQGSIPKHLIKLAVPMAIGMLVHTLYLMIDLYFVGQLGEHALAGVSAAANISMFVLALTQMLNIGTATLISHAVGRKDQHDANKVFNQSLTLSAVMAALVLITGIGMTQPYMNTMSLDPQVQILGGQLSVLVPARSGIAICHCCYDRRHARHRHCKTGYAGSNAVIAGQYCTDTDSNPRLAYGLCHGRSGRRTCQYAIGAVCHAVAVALFQPHDTIPQRE